MLAETIKASLSALGVERAADGDYSRTGYHVEAAARPEQMPAVAQALVDQKCYLESLTALDMVESFTLVYHFASFYELCRTVVHVPLAKGERAPSISGVYKGADWYEREVYDMFGIGFTGHPNLKRILLPEDAKFHPLLKDFVAS